MMLDYAPEGGASTSIVSTARCLYPRLANALVAQGVLILKLNGPTTNGFSMTPNSFER